MMELSFILPLTLLPGVALLIASTAARLGQLQDELHRRISHPELVLGLHLRERAHHFHRALRALYLSITLFTLSALVAIPLELLSMVADVPILLITSAGCVSLLLAAYELLRESILALRNIEDHLDFMDATMVQAPHP